jgi:hypothetical protein
MPLIGRTTIFSANQVRVDIPRYIGMTIINDYGRSKGHHTIRFSSLSDWPMLERGKTPC